LQDISERNKDGMGFMLQLEKKVAICKGFKTVKGMMKLLYHICNGKDNVVKFNVAFHFRFATHGKVGDENCHPFPVTNDPVQLGKTRLLCDTAVAHNGVFSYTKSFRNSDLSDTAMFIKDYVWDWDVASFERYTNIMDRLLIGDRMVVMSGEKILTFGKFHEGKDKCLYSNYPSWENWKYTSDNGGYYDYSMFGYGGYNSRASKYDPKNKKDNVADISKNKVVIRQIGANNKFLLWERPAEFEDTYAIRIFRNGDTYGFKNQNDYQDALREGCIPPCNPVKVSDYNRKSRVYEIVRKGDLGKRINEEQQKAIQDAKEAARLAEKAKADKDNKDVIDITTSDVNKANEAVTKEIVEAGVVARSMGASQAALQQVIDTVVKETAKQKSTGEAINSVDDKPVWVEGIVNGMAQCYNCYEYIDPNDKDTVQGSDGVYVCSACFDIICGDSFPKHTNHDVDPNRFVAG